jgi:hypothetical protein
MLTYTFHKEAAVFIDRIVARGDLVRFEEPRGGGWFYGRVEELEADGALLCRIVDAQSWADLALAGIVLGQAYRMPGARVLSIVRPAPG